MKSKTRCVEMPKDYCPTCWTKIETEELKKIMVELLDSRDKLNKLRTFCSAHLGKEWSEWILDNVLNKTLK